MTEKKNTKKLPGWARPLLVALGGVGIVSLMALALLWPTLSASPKDVPVAIIGNSQTASVIKQNLESKSDGTFDIRLVDTKETAVRQLQSREIYGAIDLNPTAPEILTASANGQAVGSLMTGLATGLQTQLAATVPAGVQAPKVTVTDVVPLHKSTFDISALALPMVFGSMIGAILSIVFLHSRAHRLVALALYAMFVGTAMYLILHAWLDVLPSGFLPVAGSIALVVFATTTFISGLYSLIGYAGFGLGAIFTFLVANPISGLALPSLFLPGAWGAIGQWLTLGAGSTLLREAMYFPKASVTVPILILAGWAILGVACISLKPRDGIRGRA